MKQITTYFLVLLLTISCASAPQPIQTDAGTEYTPTLIPVTTARPTNTPTIPPTDTPVPPSPTSIPCHPTTADFCITDGHFLFQPPILQPDNNSVDIGYLYGSTQSRKREAHRGVEFQNASGTPVHAAGAGVVVFADSDKVTKVSRWTNFYGNVVIIRHSNDLYTLYAHLSKILVQAGDEVDAGTLIGEVGLTGAAIGSHLHFEVRRGGDGMDYSSTENPVLWLIPRSGMGTLSITLKLDFEQNVERQLVISYFGEGNTEPIRIYYISSYATGFEHNAEDAVLGDLPAGRYRIAFNDTVGTHERWVDVEAGKLTEAYFVVK